MTDDFQTRKLHISIPLELYEYLRENKLFKSIDGEIVSLLMEKYGLKK